VRLQFSCHPVAIESRHESRTLCKDISRKLGSENCIFRAFDVSQSDLSLEGFRQLHETLGAIDFVYLVAGTGFPNPDLQWSLEEQTVSVNCLGFAAMATAAMQIFRKQGHGHLIVVTSVAAARPSGDAPAYGASKAFESSYLEALHYLDTTQPLHVTEVRPGFVDTAMMKTKKPFWVISATQAARGIIAATNRRKKLAYVPHRWWFVAQVMRILPDRLYAKIA